MYVKNVAGYNFAFFYKGVVINIPYNGVIYSVPDDIGRYDELKQLYINSIGNKKVVYIKIDGSVGSDNMSGKGQRRGRSIRVRDPHHPLKGSRLPKEIREQYLKREGVFECVAVRKEPTNVNNKSKNS